MSSDSPRRRDRESGRRRLPLLIVALVAVAAVVAGLIFYATTRPSDQDEPEPVAVTFPIPISGVKTAKDTTIGVVVTTGSSEGGQWYLPAHGIVVAQQRLALGGATIEVVAEDDGGTRNGSAQAVEELVNRGVSGIIYASSGTHMRPGLDIASQSGVPVILPYESHATYPGVWTIAPSEESIVQGLNAELEDYEHSVYITPEGQAREGVSATEVVEIDPKDVDEGIKPIVLRASVDLDAHGAYEGAEDLATSQEFQDLASQPRIDAVLIDGDPRFIADVLTGLVARGVKAPLMVGPDALTPAFAARVLDNDGVVPPGVKTVHSRYQDALTLKNDAAGRSMSAFLQAVNQTEQDPHVRDLMGESEFTQAASWADASSHDALIALALACSEATSTHGEDVADALATQQLGKNDFLVGPELDFSQTQANSEPAGVLFATNQRLGLRSPDPESFTVSWSGKADDQ
ncbi:MAG TPA: hypothetical protein VK054_10275 [Beutenbergiaceae bacterium]|nr:hypothetical protein [Beutenbergiaceae bacterium]